MAERSDARGATLALDVGDVRIGVAVSESGILARTLDAIERAGRRGTLDAVEALVVMYKVTRILVGLPLLESGEEGEQAERTRAFVRSLARRLPKVPIELRDERFTTVQAREIVGRDVAKGRVDSVAAAIVLQEYLDSRGPQ